MLVSLIIYSLICLILICAFPSTQIELIKFFCLIASFGSLFMGCLLWVRFDNNVLGFQENYQKIINFKNFYLSYNIAIDGISLFFILLTVVLIPICILISKNSIKYRIKEFMLILFLIQFLLLNVFSVLDILNFYICFESILIPMFLLIGIWGSRQEKIIAAYQFVLYTILGSVLMLTAILVIFSHLGTTNYEIILYSTFSKSRQLFLWFAFFIAFAVKTPIFPFHIWLPKAHVEAPTVGSVILAGILLKMGTYGFIRFMIPLFPYANKYFTPLIFLVCIISIIYTSLTTLRQIDLKRIIAYSSIAHMNFVIIGLFSNNIQGLEGSMLLMLSHGFISSALFILIGFLYDRYHTRIILYYKQLITIMPIFGILFLILILANISFPGTSNFVGELLVLIGIFKFNNIVAIIISLSLIVGVVYSMWLYNRIMFTYYKSSSPVFIKYYCDLTLIEIYPLIPLLVLIFVMGINSNIFLDAMHFSIIQNLYLIN